MNSITNPIARSLLEDVVAREQIKTMGKNLHSMKERPYEISDSNGRKYLFVLAHYS